MSALAPKAAAILVDQRVRFGPLADIRAYLVSGCVGRTRQFKVSTFAQTAKRAQYHKGSAIARALARDPSRALPEMRADFAKEMILDRPFA